MVLADDSILPSGPNGNLALQPRQVVGPLAGGFIGGHIGMRAVFLGTSVLMAGGAIFNLVVKRRGVAVGRED